LNVAFQIKLFLLENYTYNLIILTRKATKFKAEHTFYVLIALLERPPLIKATLNPLRLSKYMYLFVGV
jgi:hypothetical protein